MPTEEGTEEQNDASGGDVPPTAQPQQNVAAGGTDGQQQQGEEYFDGDEGVGEEEETSIFGATQGAKNATWVECDRCKKWRRLRGVVDARKLPSKWYCSMNRNDPERARCSAPEEDYDAATSATPESAADKRVRRHLRVWVRRLHCNEAYESRMARSGKSSVSGKRSTSSSSSVSGGVSSSIGAPYDPATPLEWVRCCNPSCGKWRALLRGMDASSVIAACDGGEWYCVMNQWDEKAASCGAAQECPPAVGCPPWVRLDEGGKGGGGGFGR